MGLHYRESGLQDAPAVVLLHGLFGDKDNLGGLARQLADHYRVVALDLPNHGHSPWHEDVSWPSQQAQLQQTLDALAITQCHLIGHSLGGKLAMQQALHQPERTLSLTVLDMAPVTYSDQRHAAVFAALAVVAAQRPATRAEAEQLMSTHLPDAAVRQFLLKNFVPQQGWRFNLPALQQGYHQLMAWPDPSGHYAGPTLFIKGGRSDYLLPEYQPLILAQFPSAKARIIPDAGHWLHAEKPDLLRKLVVDFLSTAG